MSLKDNGQLVASKLLLFLKLDWLTGLKCAKTTAPMEMLGAVRIPTLVSTRKSIV